MEFLKTIYKVVFKYSSLKTIWYSTQISGNRKKRISILIYGKTLFKISRNAKINIVNGGCLHFNQGNTFTEPFIGVLEMQSGSEMNVKENFTIKSGSHIIITKNAKLNLGSGYINRNTRIKCYEEISIGKNVAISENVTIWDSDAHKIVKSLTPMTLPITIGDNVWIGTNAIILKGVTIGNGSIIAAGSVVNKSIPANCLAAGVPAKVVKENVSWEI